MYNDMDKFEAIKEMFLCEGFEEEWICFNLYRDVLSDCMFIVYSDDAGVELPAVCRTNYENEFAIVEIGMSQRCYIIDKKTNEDMINTGKSHYNVDLCLELDTQAVSYLKNIFKDEKDIKIPSDKLSMFSYLNKAEVNYSCILYYIENGGKMTKYNYIDIYENLKSYELFKNFDFYHYVNFGEVKYETDYSNMMINVDESFNLFNTFVLPKNIEFVYDMQKTMYCLLMKAVLIEIHYGKKSEINKSKMLIEFVNNELGIFCEREMVICYFYFKHDQRTKKFFKKVQPNNTSLKKTLNGMAWDLTHVRVVEKLYTILSDESLKFGIHPILTYDKGLKEVLELNPVKKMALYNGMNICSYKIGFGDLLPEATILLSGDGVQERRQAVFRERDIDAIISNLEMEIEKLN